MTRRRSATLRDVATSAGRLADHRVLHPQRPRRRDADRLGHGGEGPGRRRRPRLPPQPQRPQPAHAADGDGRADLRPDRRRAVRQQHADRRQRRRARARPPGGDRRERRRPGPRAAAHRGDARARRRRGGLCHPHGARDPAARAACAAYVRSCSTARRRDERLASVVPDDEGGGRAAAAVLLAAGVEDVVVVGEDPTLEATAGPRRMAGIRAELATRGLEVADLVACDWSVPEGFEATRRWLAGGGRAAGLICMNDRLAMGAYQALAEARAARPRRRERRLVRRLVARRLAAAGGHLGRAAVRRPRRARRTPSPRPRGPRWCGVGPDGRAPRGLCPRGGRPAVRRRRGVRCHDPLPRPSVSRVTSLRIVRHVPAGEGEEKSWQQSRSRRPSGGIPGPTNQQFPASAWTSRTASSWSSSARPAAASPPPSACSRAWRR